MSKLSNFVIISLVAASAMTLTVVPNIANSDNSVPNVTAISSIVEESDGGSMYENCPTCNGGVRVHHHHVAYVYCATIEKESFENGGSENGGSENGGIGDPSTEQTRSHYHHRHYACVR